MGKIRMQQTLLVLVLSFSVYGCGKLNKGQQKGDRLLFAINRGPAKQDGG